MLKNNEEKIVEKLIRITLLALVASLLSALFISQVHAVDAAPNEIQMTGTQPGEVGNFESPDKQRPFLELDMTTTHN
jgi:hypothetical protein